MISGRSETLFDGSESFLLSVSFPILSVPVNIHYILLFRRFYMYFPLADT